MKIKTSELTRAALDWAVSLIEEPEACKYGAQDWREQRTRTVKNGEYVYRWHQSWAQGGPIIEREGIEVTKGNPLYFPKGNEKGDYYEPLWIARKPQDNLPPGVRGVYEKWGTTPLIAAMRCRVASELGDEVEIPEELMGEAA